MKGVLAIVGAGVVFLWLTGMMGVGDFVLCFGPLGACERNVK